MRASQSVGHRSVGEAICSIKIRDMFGLMKSQVGEVHNGCKDGKLHYCGLCKTVGKNFGQVSRLSVNYDAAFLAELLSSLSDEEEWTKHYEVHQCMNLPDENEIPVHLEYTSNVNLLLAKLKLRDNEEDSKFGFLFWRLMRLFLAPKFSRAESRLEECGVPVDVIHSLFSEQVKREKKSRNLEGGELDVAYYAECTSKITGLIFRFGAVMVCNGVAESEMYELGKRFGTLIYLLDAYEDFHKDIEQGKFNAFSASYGVEELDSTKEMEIKELIQTCKTDVAALINFLPIPQEKTKQLCQRLIRNLDVRLSIAALSAAGTDFKEQEKVSIRERYSLARESVATLLMNQQRSEDNLLQLLIGKVNQLALFVFLFALPLHLSSQVVETVRAEGDGDCCGPIIVLLLCVGGVSACSQPKEYTVRGTITEKDSCCC